MYTFQQTEQRGKAIEIQIPSTEYRMRIIVDRTILLNMRMRSNSQNELLFVYKTQMNHFITVSIEYCIIAYCTAHTWLCINIHTPFTEHRTTTEKNYK